MAGAEPYVQVEARMNQAVAHHRQNPELAVAKVAREFRVPTRRLQRRVRGAAGSRLGRKSANRRLGARQEAAVCGYIDRMLELGYSVTRKNVECVANAILQSHGVAGGGSDGDGNGGDDGDDDGDVEDDGDGGTKQVTVGPTWAARFFKRTTRYKLRQVKPSEVTGIMREGVQQPNGMILVSLRDDGLEADGADKSAGEVGLGPEATSSRVRDEG